MITQTIKYIMGNVGLLQGRPSLGGMKQKLSS